MMICVLFVRGRNSDKGDGKIMHSFHATKDTVFNYNSDFSGLLKIYVPNEETTKFPEIIEVPACDVVEFIIATYIGDKLNEWVENIQAKLWQAGM
jgi:hypothetical protein